MYGEIDLCLTEIIGPHEISNSKIEFHLKTPEANTKLHHIETEMKNTEKHLKQYIVYLIFK